MKSRRTVLHSILFTAAVVVALSNSAFADGGNRSEVSQLLADSATDLRLSLPATVNSWTDGADEIDLAEASIVSLAEFPQGRLNTKPPFIDFSKWEIGAFIGAVTYSSDFKANTDFAFGLTTRVPVPGVSWLGDWGAWGQLFMAHIARDIPFYYPHSKGEWYGAAAGADLTLVTTDLLFLRAQGGVMYAHWNGIHALQNGGGVIVGAEFGFYWIKNYSRAALTFNPQANFDSKNWIGLINFGFSYDF
jgi:hypothetical protein